MPPLHSGARPRHRGGGRPRRAHQCARPRGPRRSAGAIAASGWPSTTTCPASPAPRPRWCSRISPRAPTPSASAPAGSCCPTTPPMSSPSSSARWRASFPAASTSGSAARRAPTSSPCARCAAPTRRRTTFPRTCSSCRRYFAPVAPGQRIQAVPAAGTEVPLWILGSSHFGAMLAAELGLPYAFASHFAPDELIPALAIYRSRFKPSEQLDRPYAMVGVNVIAAETDGEARRARDDAADGVRQHLSRRAGPEPAADRRHRDLLVAGRKGAGETDAGALDRRLAGHGSRGLSRRWSRRRGPTN